MGTQQTTEASPRSTECRGRPGLNPCPGYQPSSRCMRDGLCWPHDLCAPAMFYATRRDSLWYRRTRSCAASPGRRSRSIRRCAPARSECPQRHGTVGTRGLVVRLAYSRCVRGLMLDCVHGLLYACKNAHYYCAQFGGHRGCVCARAAVRHSARDRRTTHLSYNMQHAPVSGTLGYARTMACFEVGYGACEY